MIKKVVVYSTPTCPYCIKVKKFLKDNNINFEDFDVSADQEKAKEMMDKSDQMGVPVIDVGGRMIVGFDEEALRQALGI